MPFYFNQIIISAPFLFISLFFVLLWAVFFFFYSPRKTTSKKIIFISFIFGISAALFSYIFETLFLSFFKINTFFLEPLLRNKIFINSYIYLFLSIFFIAIIEELIKLIILKRYIKINEVNQVIDGLKIGIWLGLGFAFIENVFYFLSFYSQTDNYLSLIGIISLRGIFSTLAHALYGAIMGYYLSLARLNRFYQSYFWQKGFLISLMIHGFFNFFLINNFGFFSVLILIVILIFTLYLYNNKQNLVKYIENNILLTEYTKLGSEGLSSIPSLSDRIEAETIFSRLNAPAEYFRQLLKIFPQKKSDKK